MQFTRTFFASFLAVIAAFIIGIPILFMVFAGIAASFGKSDEVVVKSGTVLHMKLSGQIVENAGEQPFEFDLPALSPLVSSTKQLGLYQIIQGIEDAKADDRVKGIYLNLQGGIATGWANLSSIQDALIDFKSSGKFIYAYSEAYSEKAYFLASVADSIYLAPQGLVELNGIASTRYFLKGMLEKLEVEPKVFKVGTYKSAVEPYLREDMSEANKEQTRAYLSTIWDIFSQGISQQRGMSTEQVNDLAENFVAGDGERALAVGLIDGSVYESDVKDRIRSNQGIEEDEKIPMLSFAKYLKAEKEGSDRSENKIAVIFAEGQIVSGKSSDGNMGSETIVKALRKARDNENVKAIVLRINSPGGSALASDIIAEEIRDCREKKPVYASMGDVAASGGYYIAAPCDSIYARPNTITGSIGIFGLFFNTQAMFNDKLGVTFDGIETHTHANLLDPNFPMSQEEADFMQMYIQRGYSNFIEVVRAGRNFPDSASVDKIAQGRVWSGEDAMELGLVDAMGDLNVVVMAAARRVGVENDYQVMKLPKTKSPFEDILGSMGQSSVEQVVAGTGLEAEWHLMKRVKRMVPEPGVYMMLPYYEEIR